MRDDAVEEAVADLLRHHQRLQGLECDISVRGGVAHVTGTVDSVDDRALLRGMLARLKGIDGVWDIVGIRGDGLPTTVDIGCGGSKQVEKAIGVDAWPHEGVDLVIDMEDGLPFGTASVDYMFAVHFLEHIHDLVGLMNEIHRVLKPDGVLHAMVPHARHVNAAADPTHVRYFNRQTFKYFCQHKPNVRPWKPVCVSDTGDNVLADLQPVALPVDDRALAIHFM